MGLNTIGWNRLRYNLYAPVYDLVAQRLDRGRRLALALADISEGESVLISGGGTGLDLPYLPAGARIVLTDISPKMVRQAEARAAQLGRAVDCRVMNAQALDVRDASFDVVVLHLILAVVPDAEACMAEAARVLRPGGRISVFDKFLPDGQSPSLLRRAAGFVTDTFFSDINRSLAPLAAHAGLQIEQRQPALAGGFFQAALLRKPA